MYTYKYTATWSGDVTDTQVVTKGGPSLAALLHLTCTCRWMYTSLM